MRRKHDGHLIPESTLRTIWRKSALGNRRLCTSTDQLLDIIFPGELNNDSGPDFLGAVIRIGCMLCRWDVEIHRRNEEWFEHKHHRDEAYNSVILHVVWCDEPENSPPVIRSGRIIPLLVLNHYLDFSKKLIGSRADKAYDPAQPSVALPCSSLRSRLQRIL